MPIVVASIIVSSQKGGKAQFAAVNQDIGSMMMDVVAAKISVPLLMAIVNIFVNIQKGAKA